MSIIIKALNEECNIERTIVAALAASDGLDVQVILADSLSDDRTVELASQYPIDIIQLVDKADRSCGVGAQLGYQRACGEFVLLIDGDMELKREWLLAAMQRLRLAPRVAGVGGLIEDMNFENIEFRARKLRQPKDSKPGIVDRLNGGGLFRRTAIESVGYFTHKSLHACEELELGLRLTAAAWILERLEAVAVSHFGHTDSLWMLIRRRWRSRYVNGAGELLRSSIGKPWLGAALKTQLKLIMVACWWLLALLMLLFAAISIASWWGFALVILIPPFLIVLKKRSLRMGLYAVLTWAVDTGGLVRGMLSTQGDPRDPIPCQIVKVR